MHTIGLMMKKATFEGKINNKNAAETDRPVDRHTAFLRPVRIRAMPCKVTNL